MNTIRIKLAPRDVMMDVYFMKDKEVFIKANIERYDFARHLNEVVKLTTAHDGEDACEEAFDLTNNPSRQEERERVYGRGRSVSVGDIVMVNDAVWLCDNFGWKKLQ